MESKRTELTKHYWNEEGAYEVEFKQLTEEFMPATGRAKNLVGEVVRAANRLYYEYCNNGNCNAREIKEQEPEEIECPICGGLGYVDDDEDCTCEECCGSGYVCDEPEIEVELDEFFGAFIDLIRDAFESDNNEDGVAAMDSIENFIMNEDTDQRSYFSDRNMNRYDLMIDLVAEYAIKHRNDNTPIPNDYKG